MYCKSVMYVLAEKDDTFPRKCGGIVFFEKFSQIIQKNSIG